MVAVAGFPALADHRIKGPQTTEVSCDGVTIKAGVSVDHSSAGTFRIRQNNTNPTSASYTWATSSEGGNLRQKRVTDGERATWTEVLPSTYRVRVYRDGAQNCNGMGFGHGNYDWNYTVRYH
jgi:hypothetical protein